MTESLMGFETKIVPELQSLARPIADATPHPKNIRKHKIARIASSLEDHGQRAPIVVQASSGFIVKGNGTHAAAQLLGWTELAQSWQEMGDDEAMAFLMEDNKTSDESSYDRKKTIEVLSTYLAGPGLDAFGGWSLEEFIDMQEEEEGAKTLAPADSEAAFATADGGEIKHERAALPGEKMREVPLVLSIADHAMFVERIRILQKTFGTTGSIATIVEAVRRQAEAEAGEHFVVGQALTVDQEYTVKRELVKELRDYFTTIGDKTFTATAIAAYLEHAVPYRDVKQPEVAEGQMTLLEEGTPPTEEDPGEVGQPLPNMVTPMSVDREEFGLDPLPSASTFDEESANVDQMEALRRYRASQPS